MEENKEKIVEEIDKAVLIESEELEQKLDEIMEYVHTKFEVLKQKQYANIDVAKHYITLIRPLEAFNVMYKQYKEIMEHEDKKQCSNCLEWKLDEDMGQSEVALKEVICNQCISDGFFE